MYKAPVLTAAGEQSGERDLPEVLFDGTIHEPTMWQTVKAYLANQRHTTGGTKGRGEVAGGSAKPWRQKGTGRARQGSIRSPQWRGGGTVFGPRIERNFRQDVPKKVRRLARRSAYNVRAADGTIFIVEALELSTPRTKDIVRVIEGTEARGNILILTSGHKPTVYLSARNLPRVEVRAFGQESVYDLLWADAVVIEAAALAEIEEVAHA